MRIGFDIDGVLANFITAYQKLTIAKANGLNLFEPGDDIDPPCWNWPELRGYSTSTMKLVWEEIASSRSFWYGLKATADCSTLDLCIQSLEHEHDVYFVTSRPGQYAKRQTEAWLKRELYYPSCEITPTVLISVDKGAACKTLKLNAYIDDNLDNARSVLDQSPSTRVYLLNRRYNQGDAGIEWQVTEPNGCEYTNRIEAVRVNTLGEMLDAEQPNL